MKLHQDQDQSPLLVLCRRYALYNDLRAGVEAARYLKNNQEGLSSSIAIESLKLILDSNYATMSADQDTIIAELLQQSLAVRQYFASELRISSTEFFDNIYDRGDRAANSLRVIVLESPLWETEDERLRVEADLFQLLLAKLMESGHDEDGRALKGIALLIVADPQNLHPFVDAEGFDAILSSLDIRLPTDVRSQATLACSKFLEVSGESGRQYFTDFVTARVSKQKHDAVIQAFSAAAGLFPVVPSVTAPLFLTEGFLPSIIPLLDLRLKSPSVASAFLQLLNAACIDQACRSAIDKYCAVWLSHMVSNGSNSQPAIAATILAKLRSSTSKSSEDRVNRGQDDIHGLVRLFKQKLSVDDPPSISDPIEGLAFASLQAPVKDELARDSRFLRSLLQAVKANHDQPDVVIGGLNTIANLSQYRPQLSEEQKKMTQLKAYANASKLPTLDALDDDEHVQARCNALIEADVLPVLIECSKGRTSSASLLVDKILLSLSKNPKTRGQIAQQGAIKLLILHIQQRSSKPDQDGHTNIDAPHALARILISVDPALAFPASGYPHMTSAARPLVGLLAPATTTGLSDQPRDLLPTFESLLALTNLASSPDPSAASLIVRSAWDAIEDLLLSSHLMIRRATCELVCNLAASDECLSKYTDESRRSVQRVHTLLGLADVEDLPTRRAAGGALATITQQEAAIASVLEIQRGMEIVLSMCEDDSEEMIHRGLACLSNLIGSENYGERARAAVQASQGFESLRVTVLSHNDNPAILQLGLGILKSLAEG